MINQDDHISLASLWQDIKAGRRLIVRCVILFLVIAALGLIVMPERYEIDAMLKVDNNTSANLSVGDKQAASALSFGGITSSASPAQIQMALMQSPYILLPVIQQLHLAHNRSVTETLRSLEASLTIEQVVNKKSTTLLGTQETGILELSITSTHPAQSVAIINAIVKQAIDSNIALKNSANQKLLRFLKSDLPLIKKQLDDHEVALARYQKQAHLIDLDAQTTAVLAELNTLDSQLLGLKINKIKMALLDTDQNPDMISLNAQIAGLQKQEAGLMQQLLVLPIKNQRYIDLVRDVKVDNEFYLALLEMQAQTKLALASVSADIQLLLPASVPDAPVPVPYLLILLGALLGGLFVGVVLILIRKSLKQTP